MSTRQRDRQLIPILNTSVSSAQLRLPVFQAKNQNQTPILSISTKLKILNSWLSVSASYNVEKSFNLTHASIIRLVQNTKIIVFFLLFKEINECQIKTHQCRHICTNTVGSYTCKCRAGFTLDPDGRSCSCKHYKIKLYYFLTWPFIN